MEGLPCVRQFREHRELPQTEKSFREARPVRLWRH